MIPVMISTTVSRSVTVFAVVFAAAFVLSVSPVVAQTGSLPLVPPTPLVSPTPAANPTWPDPTSGAAPVSTTLAPGVVALTGATLQGGTGTGTGVNDWQSGPEVTTTNRPQSSPSTTTGATSSPTLPPPPATTGTGSGPPPPASGAGLFGGLPTTGNSGAGTSGVVMPTGGALPRVGAGTEGNNPFSNGNSPSGGTPDGIDSKSAVEEKMPPQWSQGSLILILLASLSLNAYLIYLTLDTRNRFFRLTNEFNDSGSGDRIGTGGRAGSDSGGGGDWRRGVDRVRSFGRNTVNRFRRNPGN